MYSTVRDHLCTALWVFEYLASCITESSAVSNSLAVWGSSLGDAGLQMDCKTDKELSNTKHHDSFLCAALGPSSS